MISSIGDNQHGEVEVAAKFLCKEEKQTDKCIFLVVALSVAAAEREP